MVQEITFATLCKIRWYKVDLNIKITFLFYSLISGSGEVKSIIQSTRVLTVLSLFCCIAVSEFAFKSHFSASSIYLTGRLAKGRNFYTQKLVPKITCTKYEWYVDTQIKWCVEINRELDHLETCDSFFFLLHLWVSPHKQKVAIGRAGCCA